jgi:hypothetical protein
VEVNVVVEVGIKVGIKVGVEVGAYKMILKFGNINDRKIWNGYCTRLVNLSWSRSWLCNKSRSWSWSRRWSWSQSWDRSWSGSRWSRSRSK